MKFLITLIFSVLVAAGCGKPAETHSSSGVIKEIRNNGKILVIDHREFPGFMEAMTMGFEVSDLKLSEGLKVGDTVDFTIQQGKEAWPIVAMKKVGN